MSPGRLRQSPPRPSCSAALAACSLVAEGLACGFGVQWSPGILALHSIEDAMCAGWTVPVLLAFNFGVVALQRVSCTSWPPAVGGAYSSRDKPDVCAQQILRSARHHTSCPYADPQTCRPSRQPGIGSRLAVPDRISGVWRHTVGWLASGTPRNGEWSHSCARPRSHSFTVRTGRNLRSGRRTANDCAPMLASAEIESGGSTNP